MTKIVIICQRQFSAIQTFATPWHPHLVFEFWINYNPTRISADGVFKVDIAVVWLLSEIMSLNQTTANFKVAKNMYWLGLFKSTVHNFPKTYVFWNIVHRIHCILLFWQKRTIKDNRNPWITHFATTVRVHVLKKIFIYVSRPIHFSCKSNLNRKCPLFKQ